MSEVKVEVLVSEKRKFVSEWVIGYPTYEASDDKFGCADIGITY